MSGFRPVIRALCSKNQNQMNEIKIMKVLFITAIISISFNCLAAESYLCSITESIEAKFKHGKWINTKVIDGKGAYRVVIDGKNATVIEKIAERNNSYPIETSCAFVGGTAGYKLPLLSTPLL